MRTIFFSFVAQDAALHLCSRAALFCDDMSQSVFFFCVLICFHFARLCIIAGDISPIDVITHLPVLCEESEIKYIYVPSKDDLGSSALTKRPTSCVLISNKKGTDSGEKLPSMLEEVASAWSSVKF